MLIDAAAADWSLLEEVPASRPLSHMFEGKSLKEVRIEEISVAAQMAKGRRRGGEGEAGSDVAGVASHITLTMPPPPLPRC